MGSKVERPGLQLGPQVGALGLTLGAQGCHFVPPRPSVLAPGVGFAAAGPWVASGGRGASWLHWLPLGARSSCLALSLSSPCPILFLQGPWSWPLVWASLLLGLGLHRVAAVRRGCIGSPMGPGPRAWPTPSPRPSPLSSSKVLGLLACLSGASLIPVFFHVGLAGKESSGGFSDRLPSVRGVQK